MHSHRERDGSSWKRIINIAESNEEIHKKKFELRRRE